VIVVVVVDCIVVVVVVYYIYFLQLLYRERKILDYRAPGFEPTSRTFVT
jgi:hypothetical protein